MLCIIYLEIVSPSLLVLNFPLPDCPEPEPKLVGVQPQNLTAVDGYNATLKCSFNGRYSLSSPLRMWVLFPDSQYPVYLDSYPYPDCGCWVENKLICPINTDPNDCCKFQFIMHSTPHLDDNGTEFSCTGNFTKKDTAWMCKQHLLLMCCLHAVFCSCCTQTKSYSTTSNCYYSCWI